MVNRGYCRHIWCACWEQSTFHRRGGATLPVSDFIRVREGERNRVGIGWELPSSPAQLLRPQSREQHTNNSPGSSRSLPIKKNRKTTTKKTPHRQLPTSKLLLSFYVPPFTWDFSPRKKIIQTITQLYLQDETSLQKVEKEDGVEVERLFYSLIQGFGVLLVVFFFF